MKAKAYRYLIGAAFYLVSVAAPAQGLDPTVIVDRAYEGKLMEVHKPVLEMAVPDTVVRFDLDFDYSVFDNPYKGSYEFRPYMLSMRPAVSENDSHTFYLRAGAGYQLHPELDLIWSPAIGKGGGFAFDVFARHRSFIGKYVGFDGRGDGGEWSGYDLDSHVGLACHADWKRGFADVWGKYRNLAVNEPVWKRMYNALDVGVSIGSKDVPSSVAYRIDAGYRMGNDAISYGTRLRENIFDVDCSVGFPVRGSMLFFDVEADFAGTSGQYGGNAAQFGITPHYVYRKGRFMADLGVKVAKIAGNDGELTYDDASGDMSTSQLIYRGCSAEQFIYPDITVDIGIIRDLLKFSLHVGGGGRLDTYSSVLEWNHHAMNYIPDCTVERINATAGFEGRISSRFSYNVYGGYVNYGNGVLNFVSASEYEGEKSIVSGVGHAAYQKLFAGADFLWKSRNLMIDGSVVYTSASGDTFKGDFLKPAAVSGNVGVRYDWMRRVIAGADCRFSSSQTGQHFSVAGYADLGLYAEYVTSRSLSFWVRGGNLLGMTVQYTPLYAEKGAYFTFGICLKL